MIKIIFSDIDGTLINSDFQVTPRTKKAIKKATDQGLIFVPVSARMPEAIIPIINSIDITSPIISYNGALVSDSDGTILSSTPMSTNLAREIAELIEKHQPKIAWNVYSHSTWLAQTKESSWIEREENIVGVKSKRVAIDSINSLPEVHKLLLMGDPDVITPFERELKRRYPQLSIAKSAPYFIEIMAQGITKSHAIKVFGKNRQIDMADTIAFGDNYNDLDMLKTVGQGYVMGNAPDDIKEIIGQVTADNNHDGIATVLENMILSS